MKKKLLIAFAFAALFMGSANKATAQLLSPINVFDSLSVYCSLPADIYFYVNGGQSNGYLTTDSVTIDVSYGDGTFSSNRLPLYQGGVYYYGTIMHTYTLPGQFTSQFTVTWPDNDVDTLIYGPVYIGPCSNVTGTVYIDDNADCVLNTGELVIPYSGIVVSDQAGNIVNYAYADINGIYSIGLPIGGTFNIGISSSIINAATVSCPAGGTYSVTSSGSSQILDFGISCNTQFDLQAHFTGWRFRPGFSGYISTWAFNNSCYPVTNATAVLNLDPAINYVSDLWGAPSSSVTGQDVTWTGINVNYWNNYHSATTEVFTPVTAQIGDSVCFTYAISPTINDVDPSNNYKAQCYTVSNSWDPNSKEVSPRGTGSQGYVQQNTTFEYTIHFQNTGNDTAYNISVVDTLDADLDFASFRIISASHPMSIDVIGNHIVKFNFYNIMLPDSGANMQASEGYIIYEIKALPAAAVGTQWTNKAYIFFDFNPAIITNTTLNTIEIVTGINNENANNMAITPNPVTSDCAINFNTGFSGIIQIIDITGRLVKQQSIGNQNKIILNTNDLPNGLYHLKTIGNISSVTKLQVAH